MRPTKFLLIAPFIAGCATAYGPPDGYYTEGYGAAPSGYAAGGYGYYAGSPGFFGMPFALFSRTVVVPAPARPQPAAKPPHAEAPRPLIAGPRMHGGSAGPRVEGVRPQAETRPQSSTTRRSGGRGHGREKNK